LALLGCGVTAPPGNTGGTDAWAGACGRGVAVISSDYASTNLSFLGLDGAVLSESVVSSGSASPGLSAALSGDVVLPTLPGLGDRLVLIDRAPTNTVLTWVDVKAGAAVAQLPVGTGFASNPHDYVELSDGRAYVTRYQGNLAAGSEPFDAGNDLLIVDPAVSRITGSIDLTLAIAGAGPQYFPSPDRAVRVGDQVFVLLGGNTLDFMDSAESRVVVVSDITGEITEVQVLRGMHGCWGLAVSPSGNQLAVTCPGRFVGSSSVLDESGVVLLSIGDQLRELQRFPASTFGVGAVGLSVSFATESTLLFVTLGDFGANGQPPMDDTLIRLDLVTQGFEVLLRSDGEAFTLGDVHCAAACNVCFLADAKRDGGVVHRFEVSGKGVLSGGVPIKVDPSIGLPPRYLSRF
jgi:hypothetical protein